MSARMSQKSGRNLRKFHSRELFTKAIWQLRGFCIKGVNGGMTLRLDD